MTTCNPSQSMQFHPHTHPSSHPLHLIVILNASTYNLPIHSHTSSYVLSSHQSSTHLHPPSITHSSTHTHTHTLTALLSPSPHHQIITSLPHTHTHTRLNHSHSKLITPLLLYTHCTTHNDLHWHANYFNGGKVGN